MKAKTGYSRFLRTNYVNVVLGSTGAIAFVGGLMVAWPALSHIGSKIV